MQLLSGSRVRLRWLLSLLAGSCSDQNLDDLNEVPASGQSVVPLSFQPVSSVLVSGLANNLLCNVSWVAFGFREV